MWETFSYGKQPYPGMNNAKTREEVEQGYRMPSPPDTPPEIYECMRQCWATAPEDRPSFAALYATIAEVLQAMSDTVV